MGMMAHTCNPTTGEAEGGIALSSNLAYIGKREDPVLKKPENQRRYSLITEFNMSWMPW